MRLYTNQTEDVLRLLRERGRYYVKTEFIAMKYAEVSGVFLQAYSWYRESAARILPPPEEAESAVWAFCRAEYLDAGPGSRILELDVPLGGAVFFRMGDWNKILNQQYIGETKEDEAAFSDKLDRYGIKNHMDAYATPFYPHLRKEIRDSWERLFRYDGRVKDNGEVIYPDIQAGLWYLDLEWVRGGIDQI